MTKQRLPIGTIVKPSSVAIIGASEDEAKFGGRIMRNVVRHGYAGALLPINPNRDTVLGYKAYKDIASAPAPVDLAVIAVPAAQLQATVSACGAAGVGACVVITAQLGEFDSAGAKLQDEIVATAAASGMRLIGPNCMGMIAPTHALGLTSSPTLQYADRLRQGGVGFVSQSGALMGALFVFGHDHGVGFTSMISVGNQADLELSDFFEALIDDEETDTICLYVEGLKDPARFVALAHRARQRGKRVLAIKAGRTEAGSAMARSHTASMAGSFAAFDAMCRETGILLMDEPEAMIMAAGVLSGSPRLGAGGVGMVVSSGGGGAVAADRMAAADIPLAHWNEDTHAKLDRHFLRTHQNNPIDLGAHIGVLGPHIFKDAIAFVAEDPNVAALVYIMTPQPLMPQTVDAVIDVWRSGKKPVIFVLDTSRFGDDVRQMLIEAGMPFVTRIDDALRVLDLLFRECELAGEFAWSPPARPAGAGPLPDGLPVGVVTEPEAKHLFRHYGITTTREAIAHTAQAAVGVAETIGFPIVAKAVSRSLTHKSDLGLVELSLADAVAVSKAFDDIARRLAAVGETGEATILVQEMVKGEAEVIVGARYDSAFGAQVLIGFGGIMVEVLRDVQVACAPISAHRARAMLERLALWPILNGVRGRPPLDVHAIVDTAVRLSWLAHDLGPRMVELEINPLIVRSAGHGAVAVDGRGTLAVSPR